MTDYDVVDTPDALRAAVDTLREGEGPIAVDAERASGFRYSQRAYLVQFHRRGAGTYLIDPPAFGRLDELNAAIADEEWVLHAASQDLACLREVGLEPTRIFDTELASRLLGLPKVGLGTVVEDLLGIHLTKEHSAADWSTRPLPQPWLAYAALDVEYLVDLRDVIEHLLAEQHKTAIADQEFRAELEAPPRPPRSEPWRRLSGIHGIKNRRNLAVARALWHARDELARSRDVAPGRLVPDAALTAVARTPPASKAELAAMKAFTGRASRSELDRWWAAVEAGRTSEDLPLARVREHGMPPARSWKDRNPAAAARLSLARERLGELSEEQHIPLENLLQPLALRHLAWEPPAETSVASIRAALEDERARPWQLDLTAGLVAEAFVEADQESPREPEAGSSEGSVD